MTGGNYLNKDVLALETPHIGYVIRETENKIIVYNGIMDRYDIPKSEIQNTGRQKCANWSSSIWDCTQVQGKT